MAELEDLVLSGKLFNNTSRSSSPERSPSPDVAKWPNDAEYDSDIQNAIEPQGVQGQPESIGMGPGRTGVKGVIRDRNEAASNARLTRANDLEEMRQRMERANLGGKTFLEEEREHLAEKARIEGTSQHQDVAFFKSIYGTKGRFGHLREVGREGFLRAIEAEEREVWVVIHIYDTSLERCTALDETLGGLARQHPAVKFLRAKASSLGFASSSPTPNKRSSFSLSTYRTTRSAMMPGRYPDDDIDDPYAGEGDEDEDTDGDDDDDVDTDMLPTLLVYQNGELIYNWVRIDWEVGRDTIEGFLTTHRVLSSLPSNGNLGLPSDDEDDLAFSDSDLLYP